MIRRRSATNSNITTTSQAQLQIYNFHAILGFTNDTHTVVNKK